MPEYNREDFEAAFQLITAISHQVIKIDFQEMDRWVGKMLEVKAIADKTTKDNLDDLRHVMKAFHELQLELYRHGIPVRNIEHYKEVHRL